jgi:transcriptional regulator with XRE-family HTH domain
MPSPIHLRIREARLAKGWTQEALAKAAKVSRVTVNRIENQHPASIDFAVLAKLADALGVPAGLLIAHEPPKRPR